MTTTPGSTGCRICDGGTTSKVCDECRPSLVWANRRAAAAKAKAKRQGQARRAGMTAAQIKAWVERGGAVLVDGEAATFIGLHSAQSCAGRYHTRALVRLADGREASVRMASLRLVPAHHPDCACRSL